MYCGVKFTGVMSEMKFEKYMHILRITDPLPSDLRGLTEGHVFVFPKLDGACHSVFWDEEAGEVRCASRNNVLSETSDGTGFYKYFKAHPELSELVEKYHYMTLYGEFLTPHTIRDYEDDAWEQFYVFDVACNGSMYPYTIYKEDLDAYNIKYIPPMAVLKNPTHEDLLSYVGENHFLMKNGLVGEGIVVKNYLYKNCYGRTVWGKIVREDFKVASKSPNKGMKELTVEEMIADEYVTKDFVSKEFHKFTDDRGVEWSDSMIPDFLHYIWEQWWLDYSFEVMGMSNYTVGMKALRKSASKMFMKHLKSL